MTNRTLFALGLLFGDETILTELKIHGITFEDTSNETITNKNIIVTVLVLIKRREAKTAVARVLGTTVGKWEDEIDAVGGRTTNDTLVVVTGILRGILEMNKTIGVMIFSTTTETGGNALITTLMGILFHEMLSIAISTFLCCLLTTGLGFLVLEFFLREDAGIEGFKNILNVLIILLLLEIGKHLSQTMLETILFPVVENSINECSHGRTSLKFCFVGGGCD